MLYTKAKSKMHTYFKKRLLIITGILFVCIMLTPFTFIACSNSEPQTTPSNPEPQPPWQNVKVYSDDSQKIILNSGDEFIIRYTTEDIFPGFQVNRDDTMITLMDRMSENSPDLTKNIPLNHWFLFKALRTGETQITLIHYAHLPEFVVAQKIFTVEIK